jgi:hypothetical protein
MKRLHGPCSLSVISTFLMAAVSAMPAAAQTKNSTNQFWPELDFFINLNQQSRIFAMYTATKSAALAAYADSQVGVYFDCWMARPLRKSGHRSL